MGDGQKSSFCFQSVSNNYCTTGGRNRTFCVHTDYKHSYILYVNCHFISQQMHMCQYCRQNSNHVRKYPNLNICSLGK